jgi:uncharacterized protein YajQ (UPF0234 family)
MAAKESFDITTGCDLQEVDNAVNSEDEYKLDAIWDVLQTKLMRRGVPIKNMERSEAQKAGGMTLRQEVTLQQGIPTDTAKKIVKFLKDKKLKKIQSQIQKDQVRVTSPSRDALQQVMSILKAEDFEVELEFGNFRSN